MKRNIISWLKFLILAAFTVFLTTVVFRFVRHRHKPRYNKLHISTKLLLSPTETTARLLESTTQLALHSHQDVAAKIDWHNYTQIREDAVKNGNGEQGKPAVLSPTMSAIKDDLYKQNGFNAVLSDLISLHRSLPDIRHPDCRAKLYPRHLPSVSVVVTFHNEHYSTLLRTCWSVLDRSPPSLLREIILVDDASTKSELKHKLDHYVATYLPKVRIVRLPRRAGLIRGRLAGAKRATAKVLVFLDSHSEANVNWLPPLLEPIAADYKTCVCPFIDVIAYETFEYRAQDEGARGAFDWELYYKRLPMLEEDLRRPAEPFSSPIMAGGLFAISARFFWELGGYDPGLDIWGGEQYELSFKIWQCGGRMLDAPCSRVGHIYRKFPPFPNPGRGDFLGRNYKRVAEVWMDEYAEYVYQRKPHLRSLDAGELREQRALRKKLGCKGFGWFLENVAFDLVETYPPVEPEDFAHGEVRNVAYPDYCLAVLGKPKEEQVGIGLCEGEGKDKQQQQRQFQLTWHKDLRPEGRSECLDVSASEWLAEITLYPCHGKRGNQLWRYDVDRQRLSQGSGARCLDMSMRSRTAFVNVCDEKIATQRWQLQHLNMEAINDWENVGKVKWKKLGDS